MAAKRKVDQQPPTAEQAEIQVKSLLNSMNTNDNRAYKQGIKILRQTSKRIGLNPQQISRIISKLPDFKIKTPELIFPLLLPNDTVLVDSVIDLILWFNSLSVQKDTELDTMIEIIKWVITIYPYIDDQILLNEYYDLIMHYIASSNLAPYICHLLAFMTRAEDAKTYRVMRILSLNRDSFFLPKEFDGLLILYKRLRVDEINLDVSSVINNVVLFKCPNNELSIDLYKMRMNQNNATTRSLKEAPIFSRRPIDLLPKYDQKRMAQTLYDKFTSETVDYTNPMLTQLAALLFNPDHSSLSRILFWIDQAICTIKESECLNVGMRTNIFVWSIFPTLPFQIEMNIVALVITLTRIAEFLNQSLPTLGEFLKLALPLWKESYPSELLFESLKQIDILAFYPLKGYLIEKIRNELLDRSKGGAFIFGLFESLGQLMNNWLFRSNANLIVSPEKLTDISGLLNMSANHNENLVYAFNDFIEFVLQMISEAVFNFDCGLVEQFAALRLLSQIAQIPSRHKIALIYLPHTNFIYKLFLTPSPVILNSLFRLLTDYFQAFGNVKSIAPNIYYSSEIQEHVQAFNTIMVNILYKLLPSPDMLIEMHKPVYTMPSCVLEHFGIKKEGNAMLICNHWALRGFVDLYFELTQPATKSKTSIYHPLSILESKTNTQHFLAFLENYCSFTGLTNFWKLVRNDS